MKKLQKVYLVLSLTGIFLLLFLSSKINPERISVCEVNKTAEYEKVVVEGLVINEKILNKDFKLLILKEENCEIGIVCNCKTTFINNKVLVAGKIQTYNNKKQISANEIRILSND